jgi:acyl carrier protein
MGAAERFGPIHGVLHAAGVPGGGLIPGRTTEAMGRVLAPKAQGARVLEEVLAGAPLDFFVVCSSLASVLGGPGQADYAAANAFLDAFAHHGRAAGRAVTSVNWDGWRDVGMAAHAAAPDEIRRIRASRLEREGISPEEGADVLCRVLSAGLPQVAVSTHDLLLRIAGRDATTQEDLRAITAAAGPATQMPRPDLGQGYAAPRSDVEQALAGIWQDLLGVEAVGVHDSFFDLGGHSLVAIQVLSRIRDELAVEVPMQRLFDGPTVAELAAHIEAARQEAGAPGEGEIEV